MLARQRYADDSSVISISSSDSHLTKKVRYESARIAQGDGVIEDMMLSTKTARQSRASKSVHRVSHKWSSLDCNSGMRSRRGEAETMACKDEPHLFSAQNNFRATCMASLPPTIYNTEAYQTLTGSPYTPINNGTMKHGKERSETARPRTGAFLVDHEIPKHLKTQAELRADNYFGIIRPTDTLSRSFRPRTETSIFSQNKQRRAHKDLIRRAKDHKRQQGGSGQPLPVRTIEKELTRPTVNSHSTEHSSHKDERFATTPPAPRRILTLAEKKIAKKETDRARRVQVKAETQDVEKQKKAVERIQETKAQSRYDVLPEVDKVFNINPREERLRQARLEEAERKRKTQEKTAWNKINRTISKDARSLQEREYADAAERKRQQRKEELRSAQNFGGELNTIRRKERAQERIQKIKAECDQRNINQEEQARMILLEEQQQLEQELADLEIMDANLKKAALHAKTLQGFKHIDGPEGPVRVAIQPPVSPCLKEEVHILQNDSRIHDTEWRPLSTKAFPCLVPGCGLGYTAKKSLVSHISLKHPDLCTFEGCNTSYTSAEELFQHQQKVGHTLRQKSNASEKEYCDTDEVKDIVNNFKRAHYVRQGSPTEILRQRRGWIRGITSKADRLHPRDIKAEKDKLQIQARESDAALQKAFKDNEKLVKKALQAMKDSDRKHGRMLDKVIKYLRTSSRGGSSKGSDNFNTTLLESLKNTVCLGVRTHEEAQQERQELRLADAKKKRQNRRIEEKARSRFESEARTYAASFGMAVDETQLAAIVERKMASFVAQREADQEAKAEQNARLRNPEVDSSNSHESQDPLLDTANDDSATRTENERHCADLSSIQVKNKSNRASTGVENTLHPDDDSGDDVEDDESDVSEEDPEELSNTSNLHLTAEDVEGSDGDMDETETSRSDENQVIPEEPPRHLTVNVYSIMRSEKVNGKTLEPVILRRFVDQEEANKLAKDLANDLAKDFLTRYFWGDVKLATKKIEGYDKEGLFQGTVTYDETGESGTEHSHKIWVTKQREFTGDLENGRNLEFKTRIPIKTFVLTTSITRPDGRVLTENPRLFTALDLANHAACERLLASVKPPHNGPEMITYEEEHAPTIRTHLQLLNEQGDCFDSNDIVEDAPAVVQVKRLDVEGPLN